MEQDSSLSSKLSRLIAGASPEEAVHLKTILSLAAGSRRMINQVSDKGSDEILSALAETLSGGSGLPQRRRPLSLTDDTLGELYTEAKLLREKAHANNHCRLHRIGPVAKAYLSDANLKTLVLDSNQPLQLQLANYTYYEEGDRLDLHLDDPTSALSTVIMLRHESLSNGPRSRLILVVPDTGHIFFDLEDGEAAIFQGSKVLHGREQLGKGEAVVLLVLLFKLP